MSVNISCDNAVIRGGGEGVVVTETKSLWLLLGIENSTTACAIPVNLKREIRVCICVFIRKAGLSWGVMENNGLWLGESRAQGRCKQEGSMVAFDLEPSSAVAAFWAEHLFFNPPTLRSLGSSGTLDSPRLPSRIWASTLSSLANLRAGHC